jgi:hypothetical protein
MTVMNYVWPVTVLYFGPFALWSYFAFGRQATGSGKHRERPFWEEVWIVWPGTRVTLRPKNMDNGTQPRFH